ncbi:hypothetical protein BKA56DRAFT_585697 [Ilyonectria sp. MPI-CAGE-AT-0026]|nr:hypothetical protein BKA56DRAFT_585697 [Ilyonectria sp. MPI-CAGE-AT-0026]
MLRRSLEDVLDSIRWPWCGFETLQLLYDFRGRGPRAIDLPPFCLHLRTLATKIIEYEKLCSAPKCPNSDCPSRDLGTLGALQVHLETNQQCLWSYNLSYAILATLAACSLPVSVYDVCQLITELFAMDNEIDLLDDATKHELFIVTYPGWSLDTSLREWVQSGTVWPPFVRHRQSANHLQIHPLSFVNFQRSLKCPDGIQYFDKELWKRLISSEKPCLRWAEPITYQNHPGGPLSLVDQNRQLKEMRLGLRTEQNMLGEGSQPMEREGVQQTDGNASCVAKQPKKGSVQRAGGNASIVVKQPKKGSVQDGNATIVVKQPKKGTVQRTGGNASRVVKQPKKKGPVQRTRGIASAEAKDRSPPNEAKGRNMFTGAVGIAEGDQRRRVPFDPVRDAIARNATLLQECIVVGGQGLSG